MISTNTYWWMPLLGLMASSLLKAQYGIQFMDVPFWDAQGNRLTNPTTGGLNNPQFSEVDMNGDALMDLYILDRDGGKILCFLNDGNQYNYAPAYTQQFPSISHWALLRDYDCDGIMDLFAHSKIQNLGQQGIQVFKGSRDTANKIQFSRVANSLAYELAGSSAIISVSAIDIPAVDDIDGDGDLDILTFNLTGGYVNLYNNESQELGYGCDSLLFRLADDCWGRFYESGISTELSLSPSKDSCVLKNDWAPFRSNSGLTVRHAGSTLLTLDIDADRDKDLVLGDISFDNLLLARNAGQVDTAFVDSQFTAFPNGTVPVELDLFPAAFYLDLDQDNIKDLIVSPNSTGSSVNDKVVWFYKNTQANTQPRFSYQTDAFLVDQMIDHGSMSAPTFMDYNGDGLQDIVIGNYGYYRGAGTYSSQLQLYKNVGTATHPSYQLADTDFAQLEQYNIRRLCPTFGDLDGDGDLDGLIGQEDGTLLFIENEGSSTLAHYPQIRPMWSNIDVGQNSSPQLVDADEDGDLDLIIGERNGNFNYFENTGSASSANFSASPTTESFGFVDTKTPAQVDGNSAPCLAKVDGTYHFFAGLTDGWIWNYEHVEANLLGRFDYVSDGLALVDEGKRSILDAADINQDGNLDFVVGNARGGIRFYTFDSSAVGLRNLDYSPGLEVNLYPNPSRDGRVFLDWKTDKIQVYKATIYNALGQQLATYTGISSDTKSISLAHLPHGVYTIAFEFDTRRLSKRLILLK